jgi:hypothetical protein
MVFQFITFILFNTNMLSNSEAEDNNAGMGSEDELMDSLDKAKKSSKKSKDGKKNKSWKGTDDQKEGSDQ